MGFEDLETTLRIKVDKSDLDALKRSVAEAYADAVKAGMAAGSSGGSGGGGGGRPGTTTSTASGDGGASPGGGGSGGGGGGGGGRGGGPPPGSKTRSTGDDDGGGGGGGGGKKGRPVHDWRGRFVSGSIDYSDYLAGGSATSTARFLASGAVGGSPFRAGIGLATTAFGDSLMDTARRKAELIDAQRTAGIPESARDTMGILRYAGPIGAATSVIGGAVAAHVDKGLDLQRDLSREYGQHAEDLAVAARQGNPWLASTSGAFGSAYFARAAERQNGGLGREEAWQAMRGYSQGVGANNVPFVDYLRLRGAGIDAGVTGNYAGNARFGATNADPTRLAAAAQGAGLSPSTIANLLQQLASNTRQLVSKGIPVDMDKAVAFIERAIGMGKSPEQAANAASGLQAAGTSIYESLLEPGRQYGQAKLLQNILSQSKGLDYEGIVDLAGRTASDTGQQARAIDDGSMWGRLGLRATSGVAGMSGVANAPRPNARQVAPLSSTFTGSYDPFTYREQSSSREAWQLQSLQDAKTYTGYIRQQGATDRGAMDDARLVNEGLSALYTQGEQMMETYTTLFNNMMTQSTRDTDRIIQAIQQMFHP